VGGATVQLYVGTSGYAYKEWKGSFYPADLPADGMLRYYGERFATVEINNTFYRLPKSSVVESWAAEVPAGFRFVLKASRRITHIKRLKDASEPVSYFLKAAGVLKERLGALLFQLPPNLKKDAPRLADFLALLPAGTRAALEFRHSSWFDDEVFDLLRRRGIAMCIAEAEDCVEVPFTSTADWGYVRLRMVEYSDADLRVWAERIGQQAWRETFVFFKHEEAGTGPKLAVKFLSIAEGEDTPSRRPVRKSPSG
jgi:uncharacterized protein YecE (DUF72 family)